MAKQKKIKRGPNYDRLSLEALSSIRKAAKCENKGPTILTAVVKANGKLDRGCHAVSATKVTGFGQGYYEVIFSRNVRKGAYIATIGSHQDYGVPASGEITVVGRYNNVNGVFITTTDSNGVRKDKGFHLAVFCPEGFAY